MLALSYAEVLAKNSNKVEPSYCFFSSTITLQDLLLVTFAYYCMAEWDTKVDRLNFINNYLHFYFTTSFEKDNITTIYSLISLEVIWWALTVLSLVQSLYSQLHLKTSFQQVKLHQIDHNNSHESSTLKLELCWTKFKHVPI